MLVLFAVFHNKDPNIFQFFSSVYYKNIPLNLEYVSPYDLTTSDFYVMPLFHPFPFHLFIFLYFFGNLFLGKKRSLTA